MRAILTVVCITVLLSFNNLIPKTEYKVLSIQRTTDSYGRTVGVVELSKGVQISYNPDKDSKWEDIKVGQKIKLKLIHEDSISAGSDVAGMK